VTIWPNHVAADYLTPAHLANNDLPSTAMNGGGRSQENTWEHQISSDRTVYLGWLIKVK
jgi:hypothetical protein